MKTRMYKMKDKLHGINDRLYIADEKISELEYITIETVQDETQRAKKIFYE